MEVDLVSAQAIADTEMNLAGHICRVCKKDRAVTIHEITPKSKGGEWWLLENRIALCHRCHDRVHIEGTRRWEERLRKAKGLTSSS